MSTSNCKHGKHASTKRPSCFLIIVNKKGFKKAYRLLVDCVCVWGGGDGGREFWGCLGWGCVHGVCLERCLGCVSRGVHPLGPSDTAPWTKR